MPAQIRIGSQFAVLTRQCHGKISVDKTGKATCRETYEIGYEYALAKGPGLGTPHPIFKTLVATNIEIEETEGNMASIPVTYEGLYQNPVTLYERDTEAVEEPIETHKDFATWTNAANAPIYLPIWSPKAATSGSVAPSGARFIAWESGSPLEGQDKYLVPRQTFTATTVSMNRSGGGEPVGRVNSPFGPAPALDGGENWLLFSVTETDEGGGLSAVGGGGGVFRIRYTWHGSGGGKPWQPQIYNN